MSNFAAQLIERVVKGDKLSGKQVSQLKSKQHIFVNGKHAVVVDAKVNGKNVELVYVKGRKAFGKEQYLDIPVDATTTDIMSGKSDDDS